MTRPSQIGAFLFGIVALAALLWSSVPTLLPSVGTALGLQSGEQMLEAATRSLVVDPGTSNRITREVLDHDPLNQRALQILARTEPAGSKVTGKLERLLAKTGYRDDDSQIYLLLAAVERQDYNALLAHSDALLRRTRRENDVLGVLYAMEEQPKAREALAAYLNRSPPWRAAYFDYFAPRARKDAADHIGLLDLMIRRGMPLRYGEVAATANRSIANGQIDLAHRLWEKYSSGGASKMQGNRFLGMMSEDAAQSGGASAFDWNLDTSSGQAFTFSGKGPSSSLLIDWNGRGSPLLMWKLLSISKGANYLKILIADDKGLSTKLDFRLICGTIALPLEVYQVSRQEYRSETFSPADFGGCIYPKLEVSGATQGVDRPVTLDIRAIELVRSARVVDRNDAPAP